MWLLISSVSGHDEGWIKPEMVMRVHPGPGQRIIEYRDHSGTIRLACRKYGYPDEEFMRTLGLPAG